jgi:hypothetical protein
MVSSRDPVSTMLFGLTKRLKLPQLNGKLSLRPARVPESDEGTEPFSEAGTLQGGPLL